MLVLSRRIREKLIFEIGDKKVELFIKQLEKDQAKICIDAPDDVKVWREELRRATSVIKKGYKGYAKRYKSGTTISEAFERRQEQGFGSQDSTGCN